MKLRTALGLLAVLGTTPALAQESGPAVEAAVPGDDATWIAGRLLSNAARDGQADFLHCIARVILSDPDAGIVTAEAAHPGLSDYVYGQFDAQIDQRFVPVWTASATEMAQRLNTYPADQQAAVRAFFESPTGTKLMAFTEAQFAHREIAVNFAAGFDQCLPPQPDWAAFDAQMTAEDRQAYRRFPAEPGTMLTPGSALDIASQVGGDTASQVMNNLLPGLEELVGQARRDFLAGRR